MIAKSLKTFNDDQKQFALDREVLSSQVVLMAEVVVDTSFWSAITFRLTIRTLPDDEKNLTNWTCGRIECVICLEGPITFLYFLRWEVGEILGRIGSKRFFKIFCTKKNLFWYQWFIFELFVLKTEKESKIGKMTSSTPMSCGIVYFQALFRN